MFHKVYKFHISNPNKKENPEVSARFNVFILATALLVLILRIKIILTGNF